MTVSSGETAEAPTTSCRCDCLHACCCGVRAGPGAAPAPRPRAGPDGRAPRAWSCDDLALDRVEQRWRSARPRLDLLLRRRALGHDLLLPRVRDLQLLGPHGDVVLELRDLADHLRVLRRRRCSPSRSSRGSRRSSASRAGSRASSRPAGSCRSPAAGRRAGAARRTRLFLVIARWRVFSARLALDRRQLVGRAVVRLDRLLHLDVEGVDVVQDALRLGPLRRDRRRLGRDRTGSQPGDHEGENHEGCLSYAGARGDTPHHSRQAHREGPVRHGSTTLAAVTDTGNREPGLNEPKSRAKRVQTDAVARSGST